ncbi:glucosaminidase domain-containing protein [Brevibacillus laterosporus]|uniref:glucosaminidase domain-containing protein n=1 Tax=Brevibacillus laterosporus TaxID=1465 RepID=UPI0035A70499
MALKSIPTKSVKVDGVRDTYVDLNPNTNANDKVQAFVDAFRRVAQDASDDCYGLPVEVILAMWGGESEWASKKLQRDNQNWSNMKYVSGSNPPGNYGKGDKGWAYYIGRSTHAKSFGKFFQNNARYSKLIDYLKNTDQPNSKKCIRFISDAGYGGGDQYYDEVIDYLDTLRRRSDI